jgi:DNA-binding MarR family transcriptional regulator
VIEIEHTLGMAAKLNVRECLCFNLRKTSRLLTQYYDDSLRPAGLRITQFNLMAAIYEMRESAFVPLAAFLGMDRTTLARNLDLLAKAGLVQIASSSSDRRQQIVKLTPLGADRLAAAMPLWEKAQREAMRRVQDGSLQPLLSQLATLSELP